MSGTAKSVSRHSVLKRKRLQKWPSMQTMSKNLLGERDVTEKQEFKQVWPTFVKGTNHVIDPRSQAAFTWKMLMITLLVFLAWIVPFNVAFSFQEVMTPTKYAFSAFFTFVFTMDIAFNFNVAKVRQFRHQLLTDRRQLARKYARGWLTIDIISTIPWEIIAHAMNTQSTNVVAMLRLLKLLRLIPLLGYTQIRDVMHQILARRHVDHSTVMMIRACFVGLFLVHIMACGLYLIPQLVSESAADEFLLENGLEPTPKGAIYLTCMYWATMTVTTIGYGDVTTNLESLRAYVIIAMAVGAAMWAYVVGLLFVVLQQKRDAADVSAIVLSEANRLMSQLGLKSAEKLRVRKFLIAISNLYSEDRLCHYQNVSIELSPELRYVVLLRLFADWVFACPWLLPQRDPELFAGLLNALSETFHAPMEALATGGIPASALGFVRNGRLVMSLGGVREQVVVGGEAILSELTPHRATVLAVHYTQVWSISRDNLHALAAKHPHMGSSMRRAAVMLAFRLNWRKALKKVRGDLGVGVLTTNSGKDLFGGQPAGKERKAGLEGLGLPGGGAERAANGTAASFAAQPGNLDHARSLESAAEAKTYEDVSDDPTELAQRRSAAS